MARLQTCPDLTVFPSVTSYLLMQLPEGHTSADICRTLARERLLIRDCSNFHGLDQGFIRVALKSPEENRMAAGHLLAAMERRGAE